MGHRRAKPTNLLASCPPSSPARSRIMSAIRASGNETTELRLAVALREAHITGWRRHLSLPGRPDFAFMRQHVAVFVDGCFWHGCPRCYRKPSKNVIYWRAKIVRNRNRDRRVAATLRRDGWKVLRIWEHSLAEKGVERVIGRLALVLSRVRHSQPTKATPRLAR
jgi:DNA mismatch endonuclease, patch repair protein